MFFCKNAKIIGFLIAFVGPLVLLPLKVFAASAACPGNTFYWVSNAAANYSTAASWSNTDGGATTCTNIPFSSATVVFDGKAQGNCTLTAAITVSSMTISTSTTGGYSTGTVTTANFAVTISSNFLQNHGTFSAGSSSITVMGSWTENAAAAFTVGTSTVGFNGTATGLSITNGGRPFNYVQFNGSGGYWTLQDSMTVNSTMTITNGTLDTSATNCSGGSCNISVAGNWTNPAGGNGIFVPETSLVTFTTPAVGTHTISTDGFPFYAVQFNGNGGYWTLGSSLTVTSNLTLTNGVLNTNATNNYGIAVGGNWDNNGGKFTVNASTVVFNGTSTGLTITNNGKPFSYVQFNGSGGYWTLQDSMTVISTMTLTTGTLDTSASNCGGGSCNISVGGSWSNPAAGNGVFVAQNSTVTFTTPSAGTQTITTGGYPFNNAQFNATGGGYWTLQDSMTIISTMTITKGTLDTNAANSYGLTVGGSWNNSGGVFTVRGSTLVFTGTTPGLIITNGSQSFNYMQINGSGGSWTLGAALTLSGTLSIPNGTLTTAGFAFTVDSTTEISGGTLTLTNNTGAKTMVGLVTVDGGTLNGASTNIIFQGGITQTSGSASITGTATFNTNSQASTGTITITNATVTGVTLTNNGTLTVNTALTGTGGLTQGAGATLNIGGTSTITTLTATATGNTVNYDASAIQTCHNSQYYNLQFNGTSAKTCTSMTFPVLGDITVGGTASWTLGAALSVTGSINLTGGTLDPSASNFGISVGSNWLNSGGAYTTRATTITFTGSTSGLEIQSNGYNFGSVWFNGGSGGYWTLQDSMTVVSTMTFTNGMLDASATNCSGSSCNISVGGSWTNAPGGSGGFVAQNSQVTFTTPAAGTQTLTTGGFPFSSIQFNGDGYWTMKDSMTVLSGMTLTAGKLDTNTASSLGISLGGNWTANGGTFVAHQSTLTFTGSGAQTITNNNQNFGLLIDSNTSSGGVYFASSFTATSLMVNGSASGLNSATTIYFNTGSSYTVTNLTLLGSSGQTVFIRPNPANQTWFLKNTSTNTVAYVDVAYSSATTNGGVVIAAGPNSIDSGSNMDWTFLILSITLSAPSYNFATVNIGATTLSASAVTTLTNSGNSTETYSLSVATTGALSVWSVGVATPTAFNTFVLEGMFNSAQPSFSLFTSTDVITSTPTASTSGIYAGTSQTGVATPPGSQRNLWMLLFMPSTVSNTNQETMNATISASSP